MSNSRKQVQLVSDSYARCCGDEAFYKDFYQLFLSQSDEISAMFKDTDWHRQLHLLKSALKSAILFAKEPDVQLVRMHMDKIAHSHSKARYDIRPGLYPIWLDCMIQTIGKHDPKYTASLGEAWRAVLTPAIKLMISQYDKEE